MTTTTTNPITTALEAIDVTTSVATMLQKATRSGQNGTGNVTAAANVVATSAVSMLDQHRTLVLRQVTPGGGSPTLGWEITCGADRLAGLSVLASLLAEQIDHMGTGPAMSAEHDPAVIGDLCAALSVDLDVVAYRLRDIL